DLRADEGADDRMSLPSAFAEIISELNSILHANVRGELEHCRIGGASDMSSEADLGISWIASDLIFGKVAQTIAVEILRGIGGIVHVETIRDFPDIRHAVQVAVGWLAVRKRER